LKMVPGDRIKSLREKRDINQTELAKKIGISKSVMSRIEAGTRPLEDSLLVKLTEVLDTSADYLLGLRMKESSKEETKEERELFEIAHMIQGIPDPIQKKATIEFLKGLAGRSKQIP
jgi:transcriptional regulator with XRE-family HTH domain